MNATKTTKTSNKKNEFVSIDKMNSLIDNFLETTKKTEKFYDIKTVSQLSNKKSDIELYCYNYFLEKKSNYNDNKEYSLQCSKFLENTSFIFYKNSSNSFNNKNLFTVELIARVIKTLAYKNNLFLGLKATKKTNDFNIIKIADSLEEFKKFYKIVDTKKSDKKTDKTEEKNSVKSEKVATEKNIKELNKNSLIACITEILDNKELKASEKLNKIELLIGYEKKSN